MIRPLIFLALAVLPAMVSAAERKPTALDAEFAATDTNRDGVLSRAEIDARTAKMKVAGGRVSPADMKKLGDIWFARTDANHDGRITKAEMASIMKAVGSRYDTNHDGTVSIAERKAARAAAIAEARAGQ